MAAAATTADPLSRSCDLRRVQGLVGEAEREFARLPLAELPQLTIHGDYRAQNLLFMGDAVSAVLDLDFARPAQRLFDLAYALVFFQSVLAANPMGLLETAAFLMAYHDLAPLMEQEKAALPAFLKLAWLGGMILWLRIHFVDKASPNAASWIRAYWAHPEWLDQNAAELVAACGL